MINIMAVDTDKDRFDLTVKIEGRGHDVCKELIAIFDHVYTSAPELFEAALVSSRYTKDHT